MPPIPSATPVRQQLQAPVTRHAARRMQTRAIAPAAVETVLEYGRVVHTRGAVVHAIGRKEVARYAAEGVDLSALDGVQVVCSLDGAVITVYRNRNFRGLRANLGRGSRRPCRA